MKEYITLLMHHLSFPEYAISAISEDTRRLFDNEVVAYAFHLRFMAFVPLEYDRAFSRVQSIRLLLRL